jgi:magnesium transporter
MAKSTAMDIAEAAAGMRRGEMLFLVDQIENNALAGEVLLELSDGHLLQVVNGISVERISSWLSEMEPDDAADVAARLPSDVQEEVLRGLNREDREEVEELMAWPEDSAGGIMSPVAFRLAEDTTCREAIEALHEQADVEMVFYIYVLNDARQLVGTCSLRNLLLNPPSTPLKEIMTTDVVTVSPETDQEEVAATTARHDLLAIPVVDENHALMGIVTVDDIIDVLREEAAEDMMLMAGVGESYDPQESSALAAVKIRGRWLIVTLVAGILLMTLIGRFDATIRKNIIVAGLIPVLMAMSGNVGIQASTITVRNLATGHVSAAGGIRHLVFREARVGILLGLFFGMILGAWCLFVGTGDEKLMVGLAVGTSIAVSLTVAAVVGAITPILLYRFDVDPAVAAGPFVTTVIDLTGVVVFFTVFWAWPGI